MKNAVFVIFFALTLMGCANNSNSTDQGAQDQAATKTDTNAEEQHSKENDNVKCIYVYQRDSSEVRWTAYKTTSKKGVSGIFDNFLVKIPKDTLWSMKEAIPHTKFVIAPSSVNSGNEGRDAKLVKYFFKTLGGISGQFQTVGEDGNGTMQLIWNGMDQVLPYSYEIRDDSLFIKATINFAKWRADKNAAALNNACKKLHSGKDGVSKLWPDVDVKAKIVFKKYCG